MTARKKFKPVLETYLKYGVDTLMAPFGNSRAGSGR